VKTDIVRDLRYAARRLRRSPGFAFAAIFTLSLGIGANTAIFTVTRGVLLDPFPYQDPDRVVVLWEDHRESGGRPHELVTADRYRTLGQALEGQATIAAYAPHRVPFEAGDGIRHTRALEVTPSLFQVLGIDAAMGRLPSPSDHQSYGQIGFVVTHDFFTNALGSDESWLGRTVDLRGVPHTLVGVLPPKTHIALPGASSGALDILLPIDPPVRSCSADCGEVFVLARLGEGTSAAGMEDLLRAALDPAHDTQPIQVVSLREEMTAELGPGLVSLLLGVGLVLIIACVNVANLLVARGPARHAEIAVRSALGAGRGRILRQLLTENVVLLALGGAGGLWVAAWAIDLVLASAPAAARVPRSEAIVIDGAAIAFCAGITLFTGIILAIVPLIQSGRPRPAAILNPIGMRGSVRSRDSGPALIVVEVAAAGVLLLGAGLLIRNYAELERASAGYDPALVLTVDIPIVEPTGGTETIGITDHVERRLARSPGVAAAAVGVLPTATDARRERIWITGPTEEADTARPTVAWIRPVTPSYFRFLGLDVIAGEGMPERAVPAALVNARFARAVWPDAQAVGHTLRIGKTEVEVIGVVENADPWAPGGLDRPAVYVPIDLLPPRIATIMIAAKSDVEEGVPALRAALTELDPTARHAEIIPLDDLAQGDLGGRRLATLLLAVFSATALALAAIGLIGVLHYAVARRRYEMSVRMALGATGSSLRNRVIRQGVLLTAVGAAAGIVVALALRRVMSATLYGAASTDIIVFTTAPLLLCAVAVIASYVPARRVSRIEPMIALRGE
jgi:predicted permease